MSRLTLGSDGELYVVSYLQQHGFTICAQNYRKFFGEIDIIACKKQLYVFVEVKTRTTDTVVLGQLISLSKQKKIIKTAQHFIMEKQLKNATFRFDVALLLQKNNTFCIQYIANAFTQSEQGHYDYQ